MAYVNNSLNNTSYQQFNVIPNFASGSTYATSLYINPVFLQSTAGSYYGVQNTTTFTTAGAVTVAAGEYINTTFSPSSNTIASAYGSYVATSKSGAGTVTNLYSLFAETPTGASSNYTAVLGSANTTKVGIGTSSPLFALHVVGGVGLKVTAPTAGSFPYTALATDSLIEVSDTTAPRVVTLPTPVGRSGQIFVVKDSSGGAGTNNITVKSTAGTIDGVAFGTGLVIAINYGFLAVFSDGTNYVSFSKYLTSPSSSETWNNASTASTSMSGDNGYYVTYSGGLATLTLPTSGSLNIGQIIEITSTSLNTTFFQVAQNTSQQIFFGNQSSTPSTGYIQSTAVGDSVKLIYLGSDQFQVLTSIGNFEIV